MWSWRPREGRHRHLRSSWPERWRAQAPIRGGWWSHPKGREIFALSRVVRDSEEILVCRLLQGKVTLVHRRVWPALVRAADQFPSAHLARVHEVHTTSGRHVVKAVPFPDWVPSSVRAAARTLSHEAALEELSRWIEQRDVRPNVCSRRRSVPP